MSEPYRPDQSMQMKQELRQQTLMHEVMLLSQEPGMEVFSNIEGLDAYTARFLGHVAAHPNETHVFAVMGRSGVGKLHALQGVLNASLKSETLRTALGEAGSRMETMVLTLADQLSFVQSQGKTAAEGGIEPEAEWCHFTPQHFANATAEMRDNVGWAIFHREPGDKVTRLLFVEAVGMVDEDPLDAPPKDYPHADPSVPAKLDLGGSVFQMLARFGNAFGYGVVGDQIVQHVSATNRNRVELAQKVAKDTGRKVTIRKDSDQLAPTNTELDVSVDAEEFYRTGGNEFAMNRTNGAINKNILHLGPRTLGILSFTKEALEKDPYTRQMADRAYFSWLFQKWGWPSDHWEVGNNPAMIDEDDEHGYKKRTQLIGLTQQYKFPYEQVSHPSYREQTVRNLLQDIGHLAIAKIRSVLSR